MLSHTLKEYSRNNDSYQADPKAIDFSWTSGMSQRECLSKAFQSLSKPFNGLRLSPVSKQLLKSLAISSTLRSFVRSDPATRRDMERTRHLG